MSKTRKHTIIFNEEVEAILNDVWDATKTDYEDDPNFRYPAFYYDGERRRLYATNGSMMFSLDLKVFSDILKDKDYLVCPFDAKPEIYASTGFVAIPMQKPNRKNLEKFRELEDTFDAEFTENTKLENNKGQTIPRGEFVYHVMMAANAHGLVLASELIERASPLNMYFDTVSISKNHLYSRNEREWRHARLNGEKIRCYIMEYMLLNDPRLHRDRDGLNCCIPTKA